MVAVIPDENLIVLHHHNGVFGSLDFKTIERDWRVVGFPSDELRRVEDRFFHDVTKRGARVQIVFYDDRRERLLASYETDRIEVRNTTDAAGVSAITQLGLEVPKGMRVWDDNLSRIELDGPVESKKAALFCEAWVRAAYGDEVFDQCRVFLWPAAPGR